MLQKISEKLCEKDVKRFYGDYGKKKRYNAGIAQLVEHHVANVNVAGSSPVSRSFFMAA